MNTESMVKEKPPYASYTSFSNYIIKLKDTGVPDQIDRGVFGNQSGTYISSMISAFKWLKLINANGKPTPDLHAIVEADKDEYSTKLKTLLLDAYPFLKNGDIDLAKGTTNQISAIFRDYDLSGSTLTKAIAFFLGAAKAAGYKIGPHMKAPPPPRSKAVNKKKKNGEEKSKGGGITPPVDDGVSKGMERITVPLRDMDDGVIYFPKQLEEKEAKKAVKMAVFILNNFYGIEED